MMIRLLARLSTKPTDLSELEQQTRSPKPSADNLEPGSNHRRITAVAEIVSEPTRPVAVTSIQLETPFLAEMNRMLEESRAPKPARDDHPANPSA
jgi:hypothetical protein